MLGQGVLGTVVAVGTLLIFVLPAVMTVVIETTALRELSGQMADKLQEAADEEAQVTESPARFEAWARWRELRAAAGGAERPVVATILGGGTYTLRAPLRLAGEPDSNVARC